jgi:chaperone protein DnaK
MSYCLNPNCLKPQNSDGINFCITCGSKLLLDNRYRASEFLGAGGMGRNLLAVDERTPSQKRCVIKQFAPHPDIVNSQAAFVKAVELFHREAAMLDQLGDESPHIPRLLAYLEQEQRLYFVQEFIKGQNLLKELQQHGIYNEAQIYQLLNDLLPVLKFVHQHGVIHRDIKPENIMRRRNGQLVLIDFGISKELSGTVLSMGTTVGTLGYAPPEQMTYGVVYPASDLYAVGATCIHLLTGITPDQLFNFLERRWVWPDILLSRGIFISKHLEQILSKMLQPDLGERWQTVDELLQELEPYQTRNSQTVQRPSSPKAKTVGTQNTDCGAIIGIDLGTTHLVVAVITDGKPVVIPSKEGFPTTPSVVAYTQNGDCLVGQSAKRQALRNPQNTFDLVMRFVGCRYDELTTDAIEQVSYKVLRDVKGKVKINCPVINQQFMPEEVLAQMLRKLADDASEYLGKSIVQAIITVPACFYETQRLAVKEASRIAGLEVLRIINHPTAVAFAYGLNNKANETILVFDFGSGHFSVSILEIGDGVFEVLAYSGDTTLGGTDFDWRIVNWLAEEFKQREAIDLRQDKQALQRLKEAAEKAKIELSSATESEIVLPWIVTTASGSKHIKTTLTRSVFEGLCADLISACGVLVEIALRDAYLKKSDINEIVLVGGSTRIPAVQQLVRHIFGKEPNQRVNSDEVIAVGAAIQVGILGGDIAGILLLDAIPWSLGVETVGGKMTKIVPRNTTIPTLRSKVFSTALEQQTYQNIHIVQGEREIASDNRSLGLLRIDGIAPASSGVRQFEVTFDIDADKILNVIVKDKGTGKEQSITINLLSALVAAEEVMFRKLALPKC